MRGVHEAAYLVWEADLIHTCDHKILVVRSEGMRGQSRSSQDFSESIERKGEVCCRMIHQTNKQDLGRYVYQGLKTSENHWSLINVSECHAPLIPTHRLPTGGFLIRSFRRGLSTGTSSG